MHPTGHHVAGPAKPDATPSRRLFANVAGGAFGHALTWLQPVRVLLEQEAHEAHDDQSRYHDGPYGQRQLHEVAPNQNARSEEHTSELQSLRHLVCRLLL